jgi:hypothetical protein
MYFFVNTAAFDVGQADDCSPYGLSGEYDQYAGNIQPDIKVLITGKWIWFEYQEQREKNRREKHITITKQNITVSNQHGGNHSKHFL